MMKTMQMTRWVVCVLAMVSGLVQAATINVPGDQPTIQAGINAATSGIDEVVVQPGTYNETINFNGKAITVRSTNGALVTNIRGNNNNSVVMCNSGEGANTLLQGFTLSNGGGSQGGGMRNLNSSPTVIACIFRDNTTSVDGGGIFNQNGANPTFINCLFHSNFTSGKGGAIYNDNSNLVIINCTFTINQGNFGGAIWNQSGSPTISNSIIWDNTPNSNQIDGSIGLVTLTFSDIQNVWTGGGSNNISVSPEFINPVGLDYHLGQSSPCIDAGDNTVVPVAVTTDLDGEPRFRDVPLTPDTGQGTPPIVDMGAYEPFADCNNNGIPDEQEPDTDNDLVPDDCDICPGFDDLLDSDGDGVPDGCDLCPGSPPGPVDLDGCAPIENITTGVQYQTIQAAIDEALDGHEIVCRPRTYFASINFLGKAIILRSASGDPNDTIIDGTGSFHVVQCVSGEGSDTILEGFTITGGNANDDSAPDDTGGGLFNFNSNPTVTNCIFSNNSANLAGGGMFNDGSSPTVTGCNFSSNSATFDGGGMANFSSSPTVTNCTFSGNTSIVGGGMYNLNISSPTVTGCHFSGNSASSDGGGMYNLSSSSPTVANCTFSGNLAFFDGGGMYNSSSSPTVANCTFSGNLAIDGSGMFNDSSSNPTVTDCTFSDNSATGDGGGMDNNNSSPTLTKCTFSGNSASDGGGGMVNTNSSPTITGCTFSGNDATYGGGMYSNNSNPRIANCTFTQNTSSSSGGGMRNDNSSSLTITGCTFNGNDATDGGGMINISSSNLTITNCTFSGNSATSDGGGLVNSFDSSPTVANCILWGNSDAGGIDESAQIHIYSGTPTVNYSNLQGGWTGAGGMDNLNVDPLFVDADGADNVIGTDDDDLRLQAGSPCIDAGNSFLASPFPFDLEDNPRIVDDPATPDTGVGFPEVVDMGAYEFGSLPAPCISQLEGDINCDGIVNLLDLALLAANWLETI